MAEFSLTAADVKAMAKRRAGAPLLPFETMGAQKGVEHKADAVLENGYRMGARRIFRLDRALPWQHADRTVAYNLQSFKPLTALLAAHALHGRADCLDAAMTYALGWLKHARAPDANELSGQWAGDGAVNDFLWHDMAAGMRAARLAYIADALLRGQQVHGGRMLRLLRALDWHREFLMRDETFAAHNNHGLYQACGQIAMARRFADMPGMDAALAQGRARFGAMLDRQFFPEGVHREHSPGYHWMILGTLQEARRTGMLMEDAQILHLNRIEGAMAWFIQPNRRLAAFGDTDAGGIPEEDAATQDYAHPHLRHALSGGRAGAPPEDAVRLFRQSGYAVVRAGPSYLAQAAGFHSMTHKHADHLTLVWHDAKADILVDAGRYAYLGKTAPGSDLWAQGFWYADASRVYVESTRAHNTIEIDGRSFPRRGVKPFGSALRRYAACQSVHAIESECRHFKSVAHARVLFFKPGHFLVVLDWLKDNQKDAAHDYRQWFHLGKSLDASAQGNGLTATLDGAAFLHVMPLLGGAVLEGPVRGQRKPLLQGWTSHDRDAVLEANHAFCYRATHANGTCFATLFSLRPGVVADTHTRVAASGRKGVLCWRDDGGVHRLSFERQAAGEMELAYALRRG